MIFKTYSLSAMDLQPSEIRELSVFFAKRFPAASQRQQLAQRAGLKGLDHSSSAQTDWEQILAAAQRTGRQAKLARAAAAHDPTDENLQAVCSLLAPPRPRWIVPAALSAGMAMLVGGLIFFSGSAEVQPVQREAAQPAQIEAAQPVQASAAPIKTELPVEPVSVEPVSVEPAPAPSHTRASGRCTVQGGGIVGYFYGGAERPGSMGQIITIQTAVNVRADYPDTHNGYNARSTVRCVLSKGDRLKLRIDPIRVPGDRYWVPVHSGDLLDG